MCKEAEKNMRQARKREILKFIESLHQAHSEMKEAMEKHEMASVQTMLAECQEFAVELGNAIEDTEGENCVTVSHVENYCETLFHVFEEVNSWERLGDVGRNNISTEANKAYKVLKKQLLRVENSVKNDIPVRKEIVFFPYKASMWDSLESVYLAAKEDPDCDAYCVPIPYFDLNADRSFGTMHYEGDQYPDDLEITDWQSYNVEERKPDVIFIHNPYDEWNNVTSVHPRYYSKNLKEYTRKLVYIPYFILNEVEPDDYKMVKEMEHFCAVPAVIHADSVFVQSEKMRQIYINVMSKTMGEDTRKIWEKKILGLGSPKSDKVFNTKKEDLKIPEEWLKMIEKPDGKWKKVVFYNTGVSILLTYNEKMLDKIQSVFELFKKNQDRVVLLWRPHPLMKATIASMRPQLLEEYERIVQEYREAGWGIYDDTSDMERAVALSDAYYGDESSVRHLYQKTGRPVMIQDVTVE